MNIWIVILFLYGFLQDAHAKRWMKTTTVNGELEIREGEWGDFQIFLDDTVIKKTEAFVVEIEHKYKVKEGHVLVICQGYGGSGTTPDYFIIDIQKNKPPIITQAKASKDYSFSSRLKNDVVEIDLGFDSGFRKYMVYKNGKQQMEKRPVSETVGDKEDCTYLYENMYRDFIKEKKCEEEFAIIKGLSSKRYLRALSHDPRVNLEPLAPLAKKSCLSQSAIKYSEFQKLICQSKN